MDKFTEEVLTTTLREMEIDDHIDMIFQKLDIIRYVISRAKAKKEISNGYYNLLSDLCYMIELETKKTKELVEEII